MFEYFPDNHSWSLSVLLALASGGVLSEIDEVGRDLRAVPDVDPDARQVAWESSWVDLARRLEGMAHSDQRRGNALSAGAKYVRAAFYFFAAERDMSWRDPCRLEIYLQGLDAFQRGVRLRAEPVEAVEVSWRGSSLPALFARGDGKPGPCLILFGGHGSTKEHLYRLAGEAFRRRLVSLLVVDPPGVGGAIRLHGLPFEPETESVGTACVDYLERRGEIDMQRVGIGGWSLGGYAAVRSAAFERRIACCVSWSGLFCADRRLATSKRPRVGTGPFAPDFLTWLFGCSDPEAARAAAARVTLAGVAGKLTCPLLVTHGENDRVIPAEHARRIHGEAGASRERRLRIFSGSEGGSAHCHIDNPAVAVDFIADWVATILGPARPAPARASESLAPA